AKGLERADDLNCGFGIPVAVDVNGYVIIRPARLAHGPDLGHSAAQLLLRHFAVERRRGERIELTAGVAFGHQLLRLLRHRFWRAGNPLDPTVSVNPQLLVNLAAEQFVNRNAQLLPSKVAE